MASPQDWYLSLPPISRLYGTACVATTVLMQLGAVNPYSLVLLWPNVVYKFQVWRLLTNFVMIGGFSMSFLMRLLMIVQYAVPLEASSATFAGRTGDFVFMLLFGMASFLGLSALVPQLQLVVLSSPLVYMLCYLWSRSFSASEVSIWGLFRVKAFYLPWVYLLLGVLMGGSPVNDLLGILVGHLYYFLAVLHPRAGGRRVGLHTDSRHGLTLSRATTHGLTHWPSRRSYLATPAAVHRLVAASGLRGVQVDPAFAPRAPAARAWGGGGRRLGTQ